MGASVCTILLRSCAGIYAPAVLRYPGGTFSQSTAGRGACFSKFPRLLTVLRTKVCERTAAVSSHTLPCGRPLTTVFDLGTESVP